MLSFKASKSKTTIIINAFASFNLNFGGVFIQPLKYPQVSFFNPLSTSTKASNLTLH